MTITLSPQVRTDSLTLSKAGDVYTINGVDFDFSAIAEGDILPKEAVSSNLLASDVTRTGGEITFTLILPVGIGSSAAARFPNPIVSPPDGVIEVPQ